MISLQSKGVNPYYPNSRETKTVVYEKDSVGI